MKPVVMSFNTLSPPHHLSLLPTHPSLERRMEVHQHPPVLHQNFSWDLFYNDPFSGKKVKHLGDPILSNLITWDKSSHRSSSSNSGTSLRSSGWVSMLSIEVLSLCAGKLILILGPIIMHVFPSKKIAGSLDILSSLSMVVQQNIIYKVLTIQSMIKSLSLGQGLARRFERMSFTFSSGMFQQDVMASPCLSLKSANKCNSNDVSWRLINIPPKKTPLRLHNKNATE